MLSDIRFLISEINMVQRGDSFKSENKVQVGKGCEQARHDDLESTGDVPTQLEIGTQGLREGSGATLAYK